MTDTKRDFLYEFNRGIREIYASDKAIVSVFENIDNGVLKLSPVDIPELDFVKEVGKCIFMIKKIVADPYKVIQGKQEIVPVSKAQNADHESVKLTLSDPSLWSVETGKKMPRQAYSLINEFVFTNYENAFICQLINLLIIRLKAIKIKLSGTMGIGSNTETETEYVDFYNTVDTYINKLIRLSREKVFVVNNRRVIDMTDIYVTDILTSDKRYNYCYKFFCLNLKREKAQAKVSGDFRVLYHNYALVQIMYNLYKNGYSAGNSEYYIAESGKLFIDSVELNGENKIVLTRTKNGVDILSDGKSVHIEFSKSLINSANAIAEDCNARIDALNAGNAYSKAYIAYLSSEEQTADGALSIGYKNADAAINKLISNL